MIPAGGKKVKDREAAPAGRKIYVYIWEKVWYTTLDWHGAPSACPAFCTGAAPSPAGPGGGDGLSFLCGQSPPVLDFFADRGGRPVMKYEDTRLWAAYPDQME